MRFLSTNIIGFVIFFLISNNPAFSGKDNQSNEVLYAQVLRHLHWLASGYELHNFGGVFGGSDNYMFKWCNQREADSNTYFSLMESSSNVERDKQYEERARSVETLIDKLSRSWRYRSAKCKCKAYNDALEEFQRTNNISHGRKLSIP